MTLQSSVAPSRLHPASLGDGAQFASGDEVIYATDGLEVANVLRGGYPVGLVVSQDGQNVNRPALPSRIAWTTTVERPGRR